MKENDNRAALRIIGNFVIQAAAQGDAAGMMEHLAVYLAAVKASRPDFPQPLSRIACAIVSDARPNDRRRSPPSYRRRGKAP